MLESLKRAFKEATNVASQHATNGGGGGGNGDGPAAAASGNLHGSEVAQSPGSGAASDAATHSSNGASVRVPALNPPAVCADSRQTRISVCGLELEGVSIAGQETCIIVPRAKVAFDIGRCPQRACFQQTVLLSHTHLDHVGGLPFHVCTRNMHGLPPSRVVVPEGFSAGVRRLVDVAAELQGMQPLGFEVQELQADGELLLPSGYLCRAFPTTHTLPSQGYVLYSQRRKLRPELQGLTQEEVRQRRRAGEEVTVTVQVPEIAFTGDTTAAFLDGTMTQQQEQEQQQQQQYGQEAAAAAAESGPATAVGKGEADARGEGGEQGGEEGTAAAAPADGGVDNTDSGRLKSGSSCSSCNGNAVLADALRARVLIMELTFLDDVCVDEARGKGHMHIADFVAAAHRFQNEAILLTHFSPRYNRSHILEALNTLLPPALRAKCVPLLNGIE
ncbi:hypothetical protein Agub_g2712 [Astrephomene gubernaculifera]|uniref:Metallo-beta-lactamase domain-containing protein n=1 Tax=Astrephomene gubernaculifera TaxID=47775 RepID=A0AAD3DHI3_9CHLO|nr:hypothetical protein Agub_g2712 [Astrephomene gubernaculifera]